MASNAPHNLLFVVILWHILLTLVACGCWAAPAHGFGRWLMPYIGSAVLSSTVAFGLGIILA